MATEAGAIAFEVEGKQVEQQTGEREIVIPLKIRILVRDSIVVSVQVADESQESE